jgi:hypothetical protein
MPLDPPLQALNLRIRLKKFTIGYSDLHGLYEDSKKNNPLHKKVVDKAMGTTKVHKN